MSAPPDRQENLMASTDNGRQPFDGDEAWREGIARDVELPEHLTALGREAFHDQLVDLSRALTLEINFVAYSDATSSRIDVTAQHVDAGAANLHKRREHTGEAQIAENESNRRRAKRVHNKRLSRWANVLSATAVGTFGVSASLDGSGQYGGWVLGVALEAVAIFLFSRRED
jgi:hypothetical protein